ncbi:MAG: hypothetical protein DME21_14450 [Verrucomicrobia bacterium]|nr:MAG: hypothetical protein DME23_21015 [Verrucomicrobiota bacterium]PYK58982.1 MAG: hypothetical protein DME21_14450 [Verrucomicrobiota bacterium]
MNCWENKTFSAARKQARKISASKRSRRTPERIPLIEAVCMRRVRVEATNDILCARSRILH